MHISKIAISENENTARLSAAVSYEVLEKPEQDIFFEVDIQHKNYLRAFYEPFILACFPAALFHGEKRIWVDGDLCPDLISNIRSAMLLQKRWWKDENPLPIIEYKNDRILDLAPHSTACLMSGGVDSLSSYCRNISLYTLKDPRRIRHAIFVYGLDVGDPNKIERKDIFEDGKNRLASFLKRNECELIPVYTNARNIEPDWCFYEERHFGALLGGIAHALSGGFSHCQWALDSRADFADEWGSHPWLNNYVSSSGLVINSTMDAYSRLERYSFLAKKPESLEALRVCYMMNNIPTGEINCGKCSKCTRTKVELLSHGLLNDAKTFSDKSISPVALRGLTVRHPHEVEYVGEPIKSLRQIGENEIADHLEEQIKKYNSGPNIKDRTINFLKSFDAEFLNGFLKKTLNKREKKK